MDPTAATVSDPDASLFAAWASGDRAAAAKLIARHYDAIERFFLYKAGDAADDLVQQTFLICEQAASGYRGGGTFRAFLFGIARNILCEFIRGRVRDGKESPDFNVSSIVDLMPGVVTLVTREADKRVLAQALQRIPLDLQLLLELYYWEELSVDELAQMNEVPPGTIKSRLHRARGLLRDQLGDAANASEEWQSARKQASAWAAEGSAPQDTLRER